MPATTPVASQTPSPTQANHSQRALAVIAVIPVLASVYQTLVLTDVTSDVIRKGIETDSYQMIWTNAAWGSSVIFGLFGGMAMGAHYGARSSLTVGLAIFALGNYLCGAATDVVTMSVAKLVEGIGKGIVIILCRSTLYKHFDHAVLLAAGFYGVLAYATRPSTPLFTAYVNEILSWRWIFWINIPIALVGMVLVRTLFRPDRPPKPLPLRIDWLAVSLLSTWMVTLIFAFGWYRKWGGWSSNDFVVVTVAAIVLPVILAVRVWGGYTFDEHLARILKVRLYLVASMCRMLLLVNLLGVLTVAAIYMLNLRNYPRVTTGYVLACAGIPMILSTISATAFHRRSLRSLMLLVGVMGSAACVWWLSGADNFTSKGDLALRLAIWGACLGLFPPVFLTDEVEALEPRDAQYAGALSVLVLIIPLTLVPVIAETTVSVWTDRALDVQRQNLREERPAVCDAAAAIAADFVQRGETPAEAQAHASTILGTYVHAESAVRGVRAGFRFLSLVTAGFGLFAVLVRYFAPGQVVKSVSA